MADCEQGRVERHLQRISASLLKWRCHVIAALNHDWVTVCVLQAAFERGALKRLPNTVESHKTLPIPPQTRTGPPGNLEDQLKCLDAESRAWFDGIKLAFEHGACSVHTLRVNVEGGRLYKFQHLVTDDDMVEEIQATMDRLQNVPGLG